MNAPSAAKLRVLTVVGLIAAAVAVGWRIFKTMNGSDRPQTNPSERGENCMTADDKRPRSSAFYRVKTKAPWGDYGGILAKGLLIERSARDNRLIIHRAGPFAPPIMLPCDEVIVTDAMRKKMESAFPGLTYRAVIKQKVVELHWEKWDRSVHDVPLCPDGGEPEDYFDGPHSPEASAALGELWEVALPRGGTGYVRRDERRDEYTFVFDASTWTGDDLFATFPTRTHIAVVSERGKQWLEREAGEWVHFEPLEVK